MRRSAASLSLAFAFGLAACSGGTGTSAAGGGSSADALCAAPVDSTAAVKEAGGFKVSQLEWDAELLSIPERARARYENDKGKEDIADRILLNKALFAKAEAAGVTKDPTVQLAARLAAEKAYVTALLAKVEKDSATPEAVQAHYDENKAKYERPMVRARHILVKEEKLANSIKKELDGGADFAELAKKHSEDRGSKAKGGELPWATKDRWVPEFGEVAFAGEVGSVSAPVKTKFGFHIIEVLEKRARQPLDEVSPGIERVLTRNAVRNYREELKKELGLARAASAGPTEGKLNVNPAGKRGDKPTNKSDGKEEADE
jgi:peptidyl-prolyl cis-trans isomerase C